MTLNAQDLWTREDACSVKALRTLVPEGSKLLGALELPEAGFLAARWQDGQRSLVYLKALKMLLVLDAQASEAAKGVEIHRFESLTALLPEGSAKPEFLREVDLIGAAAGDWTVWFHRDKASAQSAVSFIIPKGPETRFLVTGLAPGAWDVWHDGWREEFPLRVAPEAGAAFWKGLRGSYFLRRQTGQ